MKDVINCWLMRLKRITFLRILVSPYKKWRIRQVYQEYLASGNSQKLEKLKDTHKGERCFIIGNGPSLRIEDLEQLKGEFTFASNRIYEIFDKTTWRPDVYLAVDSDFLREEYQNINSVPCKIKLLQFCICKDWTEHEAKKNEILIWIDSATFDIRKVSLWEEKSAHIPENVSFGFSEGRTVTFEAIQMAIHMGFREIYLLGVDFNYSRVIDENGVIRNVDGVTDYFNQKTYDTTLMYYTPVKHAYEAAHEYCDTHGIVIKNATRGGMLEIFERVNFDSLF